MKTKKIVHLKLIVTFDNYDILLNIKQTFFCKLLTNSQRLMKSMSLSFKTYLIIRFQKAYFH